MCTRCPREDMEAERQAECSGGNERSHTGSKQVAEKERLQMQKERGPNATRTRVASTKSQSRNRIKTRRKHLTPGPWGRGCLGEKTKVYNVKHYSTFARFFVLAVTLVGNVHRVPSMCPL